MVSVALCTYNGENYIKEQLLSILKQTISVDEIIICDDGSTDDTINIIKDTLNDYSIYHKIYINNKKLGVSRNFFNAIRQCRGEIIFTSDQDDVWLPNKVEIILNKFKEENDRVLVFSDAYIVDENLNYMNYTLKDLINIDFKNIKSKDYYNIFLNKNIVTGATMAFKKEIINYMEEEFPQYWLHDGWIAINSVLHGECLFIDKPLIKYRQHSKNVVGSVKYNYYIRFLKWLGNLKNLEKFRKEKVYAYTYFYRSKNKYMNDEMIVKIRECINFWKELDSVESCSKFARFKILLNNFLNKNYKKYYTGIIGFIRDIIYIFMENT